MFNIQNLSMKFGDRVLFEKVSLNLKSNHIYGLIGANGCGKSTFLKILSGEAEQSSGEFSYPKKSKIGVLSQDYYLFEEESLVDIVIMGKSELWEAMTARDKLLSKELTESDIEKFSELEEKIALLGRYEAENTAEELLVGLGIEKSKQRQSLSTFSGGYKMRVMLAKLLFNTPDLLLLDEPTNYLDIHTIAWLAQYLRSFEGTVVVCSHDRLFLNEISSSIIDIDFGSLKVYPGNYEDFVELKRDEILQKQAAISNIEKKQKQLTGFIEKYGAKASKAKQAHSKEKVVDRLEMEKQSHEILPSSRAYPDFIFKMGVRLSAIPLKVANISKSYGEKQVLKDVSFQIERGEKVAIVGPNGIGKSTLLEIITQHKESNGGSTEFSDTTKWSYFPQLFEKFLDFDMRIFDYVKENCPKISEQKIYEALGRMLFKNEDVRKKIGFLSGGEKARVALCVLMLKEHNFLIFDEPTNHLDMESSEMLLKSLIQYDGCVLIVSHNRFFIQNLASHIIEITHDEIVSYKGTYEEYLKFRETDYLSYSRKKTPTKEKKKVGKLDKKEENKKRKECEKKLKLNELEMENINKALQDPNLYTSRSDSEIKELFAKKKEVQELLDSLYEQWDVLSD